MTKDKAPLELGLTWSLRTTRKAFTSAHQQPKEFQGKDGATAELDGCPGNGRQRDATK